MRRSSTCAGCDHISGTPREIAKDLRTRIANEVGLAITIGVARTKFLAKVASGVAKPDGLLVVPPEGELAFLHPLAVERVWGVGQVTAAKLHAIGVATVADLARADRDLLVETVGRAAARQLHALAHNLDPRPVQVRRRRRSIGAQRALGRGPHPPDELEIVLRILVDRVTRRMRTAHRACRTVVLRLRFADYTRATRSHTLREATTRTDAIMAAAQALLAKALALIESPRHHADRSRALEPHQLRGRAARASLRARARLDTTIDSIRDRYGSGALTRGVLVGRDPGHGCRCCPIDRPPRSTRGQRSCPPVTLAPARCPSTLPPCPRTSGSRCDLIRLAAVVITNTTPMTASETPVEISGTP